MSTHGALTPSATIVVPNYNYGRFLPDCLRSLDQQSHENLRIVVIDDRSTDESPDILRRWVAETQRDVQVVIKDENRGPANSYNLALDLLARHPTDFVAFLDSDDFLHPDKITRQVEAFRRAGDGTVVVFSDADLLHEDGTTSANPAAPPRPGESTTHRLLAGGSFFAVNAGLIRTAALQRIRRFDESIRVCDLHLWLQLSRLGEFRYEPFTAATVRAHAGSISRTGNLAAHRLRLMAANVETEADRRAARRRGRQLLKALSRDEVRPPFDAYVRYFGATRDPVAVLLAGRLLMPASVVRHAHWAQRRVRGVAGRS